MSVNFVRVFRSFKLLFKVSIKTVVALSMGMDEYKLMTSYDTLISSDPNIIKIVLKDFLHIAHSICSKKYIKEQEQFLINMFVENGHNKQHWKNLVIKYNSKKNNKDNHKNKN